MYSTDSCSPHTSWLSLKLFHYATVFTKLLHNAKRVKSLSCSLFYNSFASKHNALERERPFQAFTSVTT